jgi:hypothetical protein
MPMNQSTTFGQQHMYSLLKNTSHTQKRAGHASITKLASNLKNFDYGVALANFLPPMTLKQSNIMLVDCKMPLFNQ